ncbi:uncharacterized protein BJ171DRAFT_585363 [Polychytrium aggregatum]|uniref:uncharacterized protein n=1 Tax=Polychytrium aggregatum TaxID=110093 RepID=UPI0022FE5124|nr:uncharacterized protein BJ171DRAFT_585363 [Polychytrium aggregatum]KAI9199333.1 hypothetical protein BJ171DRAFT_585363 [Polychytrium aggregatum]
MDTGTRSEWLGLIHIVSFGLCCYGMRFIRWAQLHKPLAVTQLLSIVFWGLCAFFETMALQTACQQDQHVVSCSQIFQTLSVVCQGCGFGSLSLGYSIRLRVVMIKSLQRNLTWILILLSLALPSAQILEALHQCCQLLQSSFYRPYVGFMTLLFSLISLIDNIAFGCIVMRQLIKGSQSFSQFQREQTILVVLTWALNISNFSMSLLILLSQDESIYSFMVILWSFETLVFCWVNDFVSRVIRRGGVFIIMTDEIYSFEFGSSDRAS